MLQSKQNHKISCNSEKAIQSDIMKVINDKLNLFLYAAVMS